MLPKAPLTGVEIRMALAEAVCADGDVGHCVIAILLQHY
ncbi:hypothetical protein METHB2_370006 [Candidatus Methylobacter favarea]|uniref:Uncharacterized protein n=1 Tax=Candidatus Methylobacter favarea TaxID=2707345 RepID=A0A8S0X8J6_9GAMM|nr:hypothetical protein METHB2_370006 [Candidatus Methylobacter favarea]